MYIPSVVLNIIVLLSYTVFLKVCSGKKINILLFYSILFYINDVTPSLQLVWHSIISQLSYPAGPTVTHTEKLKREEGDGDGGSTVQLTHKL